jgi:hypothetical protein
MSNDNEVVQTQWSIDNTLFAVAGILRKLNNAVRLDEAQGNAFIAFSALGSSILVSPERINDGLDALDTRGRYFRLERFAMMLGLHTGGVATLIRNEVRQCVPAFLLATSLKTMLDDSAIGAILFEMLSLQGLASNPDLRSSRRDLTAIVSALSGFSDIIIPARVVQTVETTLKQVTTDPRDLNLAFLQPDTKQIAEVYSRIFGFLQDDEKKGNIITLRGISSCILIASSLMWLREGDVSLAFDQTTIFTSNSSRILVDIRTSEQAGHWTIQEWQEAKSVSTVVVKREENLIAQKLPIFVPVSAARSIVQAQYSLDATETRLVGHIAAALVELALEKGDIMSDATAPGITPRFVKLKEVSQKAYLTACRKCMECYGWDSPIENDAATVERYAKDYRSWMEHGCPNLGQPQEGEGHSLFQKPLEALAWVLQRVSEWSSSCSGLPVQQISPKVAEAACYMAAESTYSSTCTRFAHTRYFRTGQFDTIAENAMHILHSVFNDALVAAMRVTVPTVKPSSTMHHMNKITVGQFRAQAMASLLPGASMAVGYTGTHESGISGRDLIYATNGYVAMASSVNSITTQRSDCLAVEIIPGYLRWDGDDISLQRLMDSGPFGDEGVATTLASHTLDPYDTAGQYMGLVPRQDPDEASMKHHLAVDKKILCITTSILHPSTNHRVRVDWIGSMEAIIMAQHVDEGAIPSFIEETIVEDWKRINLWRTIGWTTAIGKIAHKQGIPIRYISQTYNHEELRFFLAGRRSMQRLFIRHGTTPLVTCIQEALSYEQTSGEALRTVRDPRPAWIRPDMEEQMRFPGWLIIT